MNACIVCKSCRVGGRDKYFCSLKGALIAATHLWCRLQQHTWVFLAAPLPHTILYLSFSLLSSKILGWLVDLPSSQSISIYVWPVQVQSLQPSSKLDKPVPLQVCVCWVGVGAERTTRCHRMLQQKSLKVHTDAIVNVHRWPEKHVRIL